ncbi:MAG: hypothetical protein P1V20_25070 [Verrucomicrobiales bacterium]|nr:hypothetical protein [Verrucomicrobiales bacterium]
MSEDDKLQKLLRLKNYETPGEEYFDNFLSDMKQRQRLDAMKLSPASLMKERVVEWYNDMGSAKWAVPAGSFAAVLVTFFAFTGKVREEQLSHTGKTPVGDLPGKAPRTQIIDLQLPEAGNMSADKSKGNSPVLPAGFTGFREL